MGREFGHFGIFAKTAHKLPYLGWAGPGLVV